ncbi:MAG TPA: carboxypeptidase-like regulatory domain-containing protein, partial [Puia sp.]
MKKIGLLISLIILHLFSIAQTKISGKVKDTKGHPMAGASISLKNSYDGSTSDSLGNFSFTTNEHGDFILSVTILGYKDFEQPVSLNKEPIIINAMLKEKLDEMRAVTITAGSFSAGDAKRAAILSSIDVATTAGSNADITAALKTLPGTSQVGEQEGLFVRGGAGYETKQFIDGE